MGFVVASHRILVSLFIRIDEMDYHIIFIFVFKMNSNEKR